MKRLPLLCTLLAVIALSASVAYWFLALYKAPVRPLVAAPMASVVEPPSDAGAGLFGGQAVVATVSNYQLTGVVSAGRDSVAILVADGQPPRALKVGKEIANGVSVSEVHPRYVMLSEGGVLKRIDLATDAKAGAEMAPPMQMQPPPQQVQQQIQQQNMDNSPPPVIDPPPPPTPAPAMPQPNQPPVQMPPPGRTIINGAQPPTQ